MSDPPGAVELARSLSPAETGTALIARVVSRSALCVQASALGRYRSFAELRWIIMRARALALGELSCRRHRFPPVVIQHAVWLYLRFTLSYRDVEDLLAERGIEHILRNDSEVGAKVRTGDRATATTVPLSTEQSLAFG